MHRSPDIFLKLPRGAVCENANVRVIAPDISQTFSLVNMLTQLRCDDSTFASVFQGEFDWQAHWERRLSDAVCDWAGQSDPRQEDPARQGKSSDLLNSLIHCNVNQNNWKQDLKFYNFQTYVCIYIFCLMIWIVKLRIYDIIEICNCKFICRISLAVNVSCLKDKSTRFGWSWCWF